MEEEINKRRIKSFKTLEARYVHKKNKMQEQTQENIVEVQENVNDNKENVLKNENETKTKNNLVGTFQLVVVKLPWYKKAWRSLIGFLGFY